MECAYHFGAGIVPLPEDIDFEPRGMYNGRNSLRIYDYEMFAQESFADWVHTLREAIRGDRIAATRHHRAR